MTLVNNLKYKNLINYWLLLSIFLIILMIVVGGITRLTDSGLSITRWELFSGILPPLTAAKWNYYFSLYKEIPQYKLLNNSISLKEFKVIFFWEYFHRLLGRIIGLSFLIPLIFFTFKKALNNKYIYKFYLIFLLICFQGFIGWFMVTSGLTEDVTVSHYRLSIHLFFAFIILTSLTWNYLNLNSNNNKFIFKINNNNVYLQIFISLFFLQIIVGAFVSGLDAGYIYQTWPLMGENYFPNDLYINNLFNFFDFSERSLVQFLHRNLAYLILFVFIFYGVKLAMNRETLLYKNYLYVFMILFTQIFLGILILISGVNLYIALLHQFSSIFLLILTLKLYHMSIN